MTNINFWATIISSAIGVIGIILSAILGKKKNKASSVVRLAQIVQKLPAFIKEAENIFGAGNGTAKISYVLNKVQIECLKNKVEYREDEFKQEIENILSTPEKKSE